jgi:ABC-type dipeptide/oligopeptide/nickel transport system permease component
MGTYALRRVLAALPTLFLVSLVSFALVRIIPGDPAAQLLGPAATRPQIDALRQQLGLDRPLPRQYLDYLGGLLTGSLGTSIRTRRPITEELGQRLPATVELAVASMILALPVGIAFGVLAAAKRNTPWDWLGRLTALLGVSVPVFWLALFAQLLFAVYLNVAPVSGRVGVGAQADAAGGFLVIRALAAGDVTRLVDVLGHLLLPACVLGAFLAATISRMVRATTLEVLNEDFVRTARAKGLPAWRILFGHAVRNALLPVVTITGLKFAELLSGAVLTETIFAWPGLGRYMYEAILGRDYPVVQSTTLLFAVTYVLILLIVDLLYGVLDPRLRVAGRAA